MIKTCKMFGQRLHVPCSLQHMALLCRPYVGISNIYCYRCLDRRLRAPLGRQPYRQGPSHPSSQGFCGFPFECSTEGFRICRITCTCRCTAHKTSVHFQGWYMRADRYCSLLQMPIHACEESHHDSLERSCNGGPSCFKSAAQHQQRQWRCKANRGNHTDISGGSGATAGVLGLRGLRCMATLQF